MGATEASLVDVETPYMASLPVRCGSDWKAPVTVVDHQAHTAKLAGM